ncbi:hypothetical protein AA313_de0204082 [Arthrobotrys entomopaga]|nr:hypothetical protein AA313_de0204082 [Arthrobotrys entomopaga]
MEIHTFCPIADLAVELVDETESKQHLFLVSSAALRVASSVWRKTLDPDTEFAPLTTVEVDGKQYRKTTVHDTTVEILQILFDIFHYRTTKTPRKIDFLTLWRIALLADEFDISNALSPWPHFWIESCLEDCPDSEKWLFIGTIFPDVPSSISIVERVSRNLLLHLRVTGDVESPGPEGLTRWHLATAATGHNEKMIEGVRYEEIDIDLEPIPQNILSFILKRRRELLQEILEPVKLFVRGLMTESNSHHRCLNSDCFSMALGSLLRLVNTDVLKNLIFTESWENPEYSLSEAHSAIQKLEMTTFVFKKAQKDIVGCTHRRNNPKHRHLAAPNITNLEILSLTLELQTSSDGPREFFHRSSLSNTETMKQPDTTSPFVTCQLARRFVDLQQSTKEKYEAIVGYRASSN